MRGLSEMGAQMRCAHRAGRVTGRMVPAGDLEPEAFPVRVLRLDQTDLVHASKCIFAGRDSGFTKQTASNSSSYIIVFISTRSAIPV